MRVRSRSFARLNRTGRKMAADEMVSALTYQEGEFHLAGMLSEFKVELKKRGFGNLGSRSFFSDRCSRLSSGTSTRRTGRTLWSSLRCVRSSPEAFGDAAKQGIKLALVLLGRLGVTSDRLLPYGLQLVLLGEFHRICPRPTDRAVDLLKRWFWVTSFTGWFGGVNTAQAKRALEEIRGLARGRSEELNVVNLDSQAQPFPERFDARSARVRAFLLYLASLRPRSLDGDGDLDPGSLLSQLGTDAVGYVWSNPDQSDTVSSPANRLFVDPDACGAGSLASCRSLDRRRHSANVAADAWLFGGLHRSDCGAVTGRVCSSRDGKP